MSYSKFYKYFVTNPKVCEFGKVIYKYSNKIGCNLIYSNFRNQYTILNLETLSSRKDIITAGTILNDTI